MTTSSNAITNRSSKPLRFGLLGALGCFGAALLGEAWLLMTRPPAAPPPPPPPPQAIALVLDTSGSMTWDLDDMVDAAKGFVKTQNLARDRDAIVQFDSSASLVSPLTDNRQGLERALDKLQASGETQMDAGLQQGVAALQGAPENHAILLFTDGEPNDAGATLQVAQSARAQGIKIVAVQTSAADSDFLAQVTGDPNLVFLASAGNFSNAFQQAQRALYGRDFTSTALTQGGDAGLSLVRNGVWTALLGLGLSLALLWGQASYFGRVLFDEGRALKDGAGLLGGLGAGALSGVVAQTLFASSSGEGARVLAWALLGGVLGGGMALFVPNLDHKRAWMFGGMGGVAGAFAFIILGHSGSDTLGHLAGATVLGFAIGLLVALAEQASRRAWLQVQGVANREIAFDVNLGATPVAVGSDRSRCVIFAPGAANVAGRFGLEGGRAFFQNGEAPREYLSPGQVRDFGDIRVTLRSAQPELALPAHAGPNAPATYAPPGGYTNQMPPNVYVPPAPVAGPSLLKPNITATSPRNSAQDAPAASYPVAEPPASAPFASAPPTPRNAPQVAAQVASWRLQSSNTTGNISIAPGTTLRIGRAPDNDLTLPETSVSSQHARLTCDASGLRIVDLGSTNGTFLNGARLAPNVAHPLHAGDVLHLGAWEWRVNRA